MNFTCALGHYIALQTESLSFTTASPLLTPSPFLPLISLYWAEFNPAAPEKVNTTLRGGAVGLVPPALFSIIFSRSVTVSPVHQELPSWYMSILHIRVNRNVVYFPHLEL